MTLLLDLYPLLVPDGIRSGLEEVLRTISDLTVWESSGPIIVPAGIVRRDFGPVGDTAGDTHFTYGYDVYILTSIADESFGARKLSPKAVIDAVNADPTLGGVVEYATVTNVEEDRIAVFSGVSYFATVCQVEVGTT